MATISSLVVSGGQGNPQRREYFLETVIDLADAATAKGSALVATDSIHALTIPAGVVVMFAGMQLEGSASGGTGTVLDLGVDGGDTDAFVDGFNIDTASADAYATLANTGTPTLFASEGTISVRVQAATTVATAGRVRVFARLLDATEIGGPIQADAADRDQLA
jgi:hypothetical protein